MLDSIFIGRRTLQSFTEKYFIVNNCSEKSETNPRYKTSPYTCTPKAYCIFDVCTVWICHNLLISFISKLSQVYTQANIHGEVAKIQPPWWTDIGNGWSYNNPILEFPILKGYVQKLLQIKMLQARTQKSSSVQP